jgi:hypothetical protein
VYVCVCVWCIYVHTSVLRTHPVHYLRLIPHLLYPMTLTYILKNHHAPEILLMYIAGNNTHAHAHTHTDTFTYIAFA